MGTAFLSGIRGPMMHYLVTADRGQLETLRQTVVLVKETLDQCDRILASQSFARVQTQSRKLLAFITTKKLLTRETEIKETTIAIHVYGEPADYNPAESSRIRVAAAGLRKRLIRYYAKEG